MAVVLTPMIEFKRAYGVDGCHGGWVTAEATSVSEISFRLTQDLAPLFEEARAGGIIAIDIPIGLPESEPRACDADAREVLGWPRRNSVFSPPARRTLIATSFPEALLLNREALGTGISKQAYCIMPKIRAVDEVMSSDVQQY